MVIDSCRLGVAVDIADSHTSVLLLLLLLLLMTMTLLGKRVATNKQVR